MYELKTCENRCHSLIEDLAALWEQSVLASHFFLTSEQREELYPFVKEALQQIPILILASHNSHVIGFMGIDNNKLEMLFLHPIYFGKGVGTQLVTLALKEYKVQFVDVNEANTQACKFYEKMGFKVFRRSELDSEGRPFPLLYMEYKGKENPSC